MWVWNFYSLYKLTKPNMTGCCDMIKEVESKRLEYKPEKIKVLFIAEAPPKAKDRFFYFEDVREKDSLFLEMMKVIYPDDKDIKERNIKNIRKRKREFLERFKNDRYYLTDASERPMEDNRKSTKRRQLRNSLTKLIQKVEDLVSKDTKIILISKPVYEICYKELKSRGFNVINEGHIPFPGSGHQKKFREMLRKLLKNMVR